MLQGRGLEHDDGVAVLLGLGFGVVLAGGLRLDAELLALEVASRSLYRAAVLTSSAWVASKYGSENSMAFLRSSVIVMPAAAEVALAGVRTPRRT